MNRRAFLLGVSALPLAVNAARAPSVVIPTVPEGIGLFWNEAFTTGDLVYKARFAVNYVDWRGLYGSAGS